MTSRQTLRLSKETISARSMDHLKQYMYWNPQYIEYMNQEPGKEHYRFLAEVSHQLSDGSLIADVGTYYGTSALALSSNPNVSVTTYDIAQFIPKASHVETPLSRPNIVQKIMSGQLDIANIAKSHFVLLDIDPHNGPEETKFVQMLIDSGFRGILVCDDIKLNPGMQEFWEGIPSTYKKIDVTHLAHWSGTGLVVFDPTFMDVHVA